MNAAEALVQKIESVGGVLALVGDRIKYQLPEDQASVFVNLLCELKPAVLEVLRRRAERAADQEQQPSGELSQAEIAEINARYQARYGKDLPPSAPCACGGTDFWPRATGGYVCSNCHPNPRALPEVEEIATSIPVLPPGVKLISWNPKPGPIAITRCSIVMNTGRFIARTLEQLGAALAGKPWLAGNWAVRDLVERLEQCGVKVEVEAQKSEEGL